MYEFLDRGIEEGWHRFLTDEEEASGEWKVLSAIWVLKRKDDGKYKARLTPHGGEEPDEDFAPHSTFASCPSQEMVRMFIAFCAYHDLRVVVSDVKDAHPKHNRFDDPATHGPPGTQ
jgi:hypothetical protein